MYYVYINTNTRDSLWNPGASLKIELWDNEHQSLIISIYAMTLLGQY